MIDGDCFIRRGNGIITMRIHHCATRCIVVAAVFYAVLLNGCGNQGLVAVSGKITIDGKPADEGSVVFSPVDGEGPNMGTQIKNGEYQFSGVNRMTPGKKKVELVAVLKTGKRIPAGPPLPKGTMVDDVKRFSSKETCNITPGQTQSVDFDLKPPVRNR
jgi:hypothetical protein